MMKSPLSIYTVIIAVIMAFSFTACDNKKSAEKSMSQETTTVKKGEPTDKAADETKKKTSSDTGSAGDDVKY
jgi:cell division protein FtsN